MSVLALETDRQQAEAIRHACGLAGTDVRIVDSAGELLNALLSETPSVVLLPPLVSAADETALVDFLRTTPQCDHVEVLMTPVLALPSSTEAGSRRWLRRSSRKSSAPMLGADTEAFAESLQWSLARVRQVRLAQASRQSQDLHPALGLLADVIAETGHDLHEIQLQDATTRLLKKLEDDRRLHRRFSANELHAVRQARIKFGPRVALIDLSAGGALLESESRLQPDTEAMLELARGEDKIVVPFRVLRSQVTALSGAPRYRGACAFKSLLDVADLLMQEAQILPSATMALVPPPRLQVCNAW
jgi:hypothetical protein